MLIVVSKTPNDFDSSPLKRLLTAEGILLTVEAPFVAVEDHRLIWHFLTAEEYPGEAAVLVPGSGRGKFAALARIWQVKKAAEGYMPVKPVEPIETVIRIGGRSIEAKKVGEYLLVKYDGGSELVQERAGKLLRFVKALNPGSKTGEKILKAFQKAYLQKFGLFPEFISFSKVERKRHSAEGAFFSPDLLVEKTLEHLGLKKRGIKSLLSQDGLKILHKNYIRSSMLTGFLRRDEPVVFLFRKTLWGKIFLGIYWELLEESFESFISFEKLHRVFEFLKKREEEAKTGKP